MTGPTLEAETLDDELTLNVSAFKARCLDLMTRLADGRLKRVTVTKRGRTMAVINPPPPESSPRELWADMRGSVIRPSLDEDPNAWNLDEEFAESMGMTLEEYRRNP